MRLGARGNKLGAVSLGQEAVDFGSVMIGTGRVKPKKPDLWSRGLKIPSPNGGLVCFKILKIL